MRVLGLTMPDGKKRFCDSRCHNTSKRFRPCICGGLLRGKGDYYARANAPRVQAYISLMQQVRGVVWLNPELVPSRGG